MREERGRNPVAPPWDSHAPKKALALDDLSKTELRELTDEAGITTKAKVTKGELIALLEGTPK